MHKIALQCKHPNLIEKLLQKKQEYEINVMMFNYKHECSNIKKIPVANFIMHCKFSEALQSSDQNQGNPTVK